MRRASQHRRRQIHRRSSHDRLPHPAPWRPAIPLLALRPAPHSAPWLAARLSRPTAQLPQLSQPCCLRQLLLTGVRPWVARAGRLDAVTRRPGHRPRRHGSTPRRRARPRRAPVRTRSARPHRQAARPDSVGRTRRGSRSADRRPAAATAPGCRAQAPPSTTRARAHRRPPVAYPQHAGTSHSWGVGRRTTRRPSPRTSMRGVPTTSTQTPNQSTLHRV